MKRFSWLVFLLMLLPLISIVNASDNTMDYVACWQLDEGNFSDSGSGGYTFVDQGTANTTGKILSARQFTGSENDGINATTLDLDFSKNKTIEMWIYIDSCANDCALTEMWGTAAAREYGIFLGSAGAYSNKIRTSVYDTGDKTCDTTQTVSTLAGGYHLYQFIYNRTGPYIEVFIDGTTSCRTNVGTLQNIGHKFSLGEKVGGISTSSYSGRVDQVVVYDKALNESERALNYNSGNALNCFGRTNVPTGPVNQDFTGRAIFDKNLTRPTDIWFNYSVLGNYSYSEIFRNGTLIYNGSNKFVNATGLVNMTTYFFSVNTIWNSTQFNNTNISLTTIQSNQTYPSLDSLTLYFDKNLTTYTTIWLNFSCVGNCSYYEKYRNSVLIENSSNLFFNNTGLTNGTLYSFYVIGYWNSTLYNISYINISTSQTPQSTVPALNVTLIETLLNQTLQESKSTGEAINMIWLILFVSLFLVIALVLRQPIIAAISGVGFAMIGLYYMDKFTNEGLQWAQLNMYVFFFLGLVVILVSVLLALIGFAANPEDDQKKRFYKNY